MLGASCRVVADLPPPSFIDRHGRRVRDALALTLSSLSPKSRQVLALAAMGGLAPIDIAPVVGMSVDAVAIMLGDATNEVVNRLVA